MLRFNKVTKKFKDGKTALDEVSFQVLDQEFVFLTGPSGAGKTTIFNLIIGVEKVSAGLIKFNDWNITKLPLSKIPILRRKIGVVFQELKLLMDRSVFENVSLAVEVLGEKSSSVKEKVSKALDIVGLTNDLDKFPLQLSGGELQRISIAQAIVKKPELLLADEPTADLDPANGWEIIKLLNEINKMGTTVIMATHNLEIVNSLGKRVVSLDKGKIIKDEEQGKY